MNLRKWIAVLLIALLTLTMVAGCKSSKNDEEAVSGDYVEGEEYTQSGDKPEKGEGSEIIENEDPKGDSEQEQKPSDKEEQKPSDKEEQTPSDKEEQKPSDKEEQKPSDKEEQEPSDKDEQEPSDKEEQKPDNNQQTPSQDEEDEDDSFLDEDDPFFDDEDFIDEDEDGEPDEDDTPSGKPSGGTPVQKPNSNVQDTLFANTLKIVGYNVRMKNDGNGNDIADRQPRFKAMVEELQPDIMALSEANEAWIKYLEKNIVGSKYQMLYTYRAPKNKEAQPLLFDKSKFELLDNGYFWLSETPDVPSKGWGGEYYRGATWAKLRVRDTGKVFLYYSTHLTGAEAISVPSVKLLYSHAKERGGFSQYPVFVSGDFNFTKDSAAYKEITKNFRDVNAVLGYDPTVTYTAYKEDGSGKLIDYVMCSPNGISPKKYQVIQKKYLNGHISDHRGLYVEALLT